ncbi:hypothetical protein C8T65DRAFT_280532 [Cerioporus squamosus]|nr:hypothetical protein C8T65DRAFT_280532 [Cerioporus squamosus]
MKSSMLMLITAALALFTTGTVASPVDLLAISAVVETGAARRGKGIMGRAEQRESLNIMRSVHEEIPDLRRSEHGEIPQLG